MAPIYFSARTDQCWYQGDRRLWEGVRVRIALVGSEIEGVMARSEIQAGRWFIRVMARFSSGGQDMISIVPKDGMLIEIVE